MLADLSATAHLLARWPATERPRRLEVLLTQACAADQYARRFGRPHPSWGDGSLLSRALAETGPRCAEDYHYWSSLALLAATIASRKAASTA